MARQKIFALYKGDEFIDVGTVKELAKKRNVKPESIRYLSTPAYERKIANRKNSKALIAIKMEDEEMEEDEND